MTMCCDTGRPSPQHEHVWTAMSREVKDESLVTAKAGLRRPLNEVLTARNLGHDAHDTPDGRGAGVV